MCHIAHASAVLEVTKSPALWRGGKVGMLKQNRTDERVPGFGCTYLRFTETCTLFGLAVLQVRGERTY